MARPASSATPIPTSRTGFRPGAEPAWGGRHRAWPIEARTRSATCEPVIFLEGRSLFGTALDDLVTIRWLCERAADRDALVVVDESNANYHPPAFSAVPLTGEVPNLVVARGFSKAYGMGGLRLGYCASSPELRSRLRGLIPPLLASSLSLRIGAAILRAGDVAEPLRARIATAKPLLVRFLATAGFTDVLPAGDDLPYVFLAGAIGPIHARLLQRGVIGKPHGSWSWASETSPFLPARHAVARRPARRPAREVLGGADRLARAPG